MDAQRFITRHPNNLRRYCYQWGQFEMGDYALDPEPAKTANANSRWWKLSRPYAAAKAYARNHPEFYFVGRLVDDNGTRRVRIMRVPHGFNDIDELWGIVRPLLNDDEWSATTTAIHKAPQRDIRRLLERLWVEHHHRLDGHPLL